MFRNDFGKFNVGGEALLVVVHVSKERKYESHGELLVKVLIDIIVIVCAFKRIFNSIDGRFERMIAENGLENRILFGFISILSLHWHAFGRHFNPEKCGFCQLAKEILLCRALTVAMSLEQ